MASVNLLRGRPGAGKGYEGVAFHIIPAIQAGRKVITNMQLNVDHFCTVFGEHVRDLLECRPDRVQIEGVPGKKVVLAKYRWQFSDVSDYDSDWRHPETGQGPLYVIDECHKALRKGDELREVEEWFAEVRHTGSNVLLMTQGTRKVNPNIMDLVQLTFLCSKVPGDESSYYRKVIDGLRGQAINTATRKYESWVYPFYKSHTKTDVAVTEALTNDVKSLSSHWVIRGAKLFMVGGVLWFAYLILDFMYFDDPPPSDPVTEVQKVKPSANLTNDYIALESAFNDSTSSPSSVPVVDAVQTMHDELPSGPNGHPFEGYNIAIKGTVGAKGVTKYVLSFAQNGQTAFQLTSSQLAENGYEISDMGQCLMKLGYESYQKYITCGYHNLTVASSISAPSVESL
mgnify:CR=1 FL=1